MSMPDTPTPPSPEQPREREGETRATCSLCGRTSSLLSEGGREGWCREHGWFAAASLPPSAETMEPVTEGDVRRRIMHEPAMYAAYTMGKRDGYRQGERDFAAPPSAGSGETEDELVREPSTDDALLYEFYEASWRFASNHNGLTSLNAKRFNAVRKQLRARLAAHPAGPTRAEEGE